ncbi:MAG: hypothetical protein K6G31_00105 [Paludibacteraceae bacterium]|nr:hypothetical protein [Paludibacteraceae bacterium]
MTVRKTYYSIQSTTPYNTPIPRLDEGKIRNRNINQKRQLAHMRSHKVTSQKNYPYQPRKLLTAKKWDVDEIGQWTRI